MQTRGAFYRFIFDYVKVALTYARLTTKTKTKTKTNILNSQFREFQFDNSGYNKIKSGKKINRNIF